MADTFEVRINTKPITIALQNFSNRITRGSLLKVFGEVMRGSVEQTFREQGSPAGSWPALAPSTVKRDKTAGPGRKILIRSGRLKNSITYAVVGNDRLLIGTNLRYAGIHQLGGQAGRGRKAKIPARPYLVFRPEDPARLQRAGDIYISSQAKASGLN